jgi:hypothetical protein
MVRQDLSRRSRYSFIYDQWGDQDDAGDPFDMTRWAHRPTHGGKDDQVILDLSPGDHFDSLRIQRTGDTIHGLFCSGSDLCDEPDFERLDQSVWTNPPEAVLVGLAFSSLTNACCKGPLAIAFDRVELELAPDAEVLPAPDPEPAGVEITWEATPRALDQTIVYDIALAGGLVNFDGSVGGEAIAGASEVDVPPLDCGPTFRRGDADASGKVDLTDAVVVLGYLFQGVEAPGCLDAADADDSGKLDLTDAVFLLGFLFQGGGTPPAPGPFACGVDTTPSPGITSPCVYAKCP